MFVGGRRLRLAVLAALISVGAGGCSGGSDSPQSLPPISTTPAPSQSSAPPQSPKAAAVAVVREYFRLINQLPRTMNGQALADLMTKSCACREQLAAIRHAKEKGEHYTDHWRHLSLAPAINGPTSIDVLARYDTAAGGLVDANGKRVTYAAPKQGVQRLFQLVLDAGDWKIDRIAEA